MRRGNRCLSMTAAVLPTDKLAHCDYQFLDALIGPAHTLVGLPHKLICFLELFGDPIEAFAGLPGQVGDQFLQRNLILGDELHYLL
jgi:hypothetical protein